MKFWSLIWSILVVSVLVHPVALAAAGLFMFVRDGEIGGLFTVLATPMTLAFFGIPILFGSLLVIVPTYLVLSRLGYRRLVPFFVFAVGAGVWTYLKVADPAPTGAIPGYDQSAQGFTALTLMLWAAYAWLRLDLES